jgi:hypothetical protein
MGETAVALDPREPSTKGFEGRRRRNIQLALVHAALALAFLAWFVWAQVHRG